MTAVPVILDTDFSSDVDDLGDLAVTLAYHRLGYANLIGAIVNSSHSKSPGAVDAVCQSRGLDIHASIGCWKGAALDPSAPAAGTDFAATIYDGGYTRTLGLASTVTDAVTVYRTLLAARTTADVTIINTGFPGTLATLLQSAADGISPLTGSQLVTASVKRIIWAAGRFPSGSPSPEFNAAADPTNSAYLAANCPVPLVFSGVEVGGQVYTGVTSQTALASGDAVRVGYNLAFGTGHPAWGQTAIMAGVEGYGGGLFTTVRGTAVFNSSTGALTSWTTSATGPHYYLVRAVPGSEYQTRLEQLLVAAPTGTAISTWTGHALLGMAVT